MLLAKDVKASSATFTCDGQPVSGLYQVGSEVVAMIHLPECGYTGQPVFYVFRGQHGTSAVEHEAGTALMLIATGEML